MADSLDDFFAKKDKKKGKGKAVLSAGALVKELEEGSKQTEYPVRKEAKTSTAIELLGLDADDADWRDFEDMEKRDYTGLKVKEMSLQDQSEEEQRRLSADQSESVPDSTAWKIKDDSAQPPPPAEVKKPDAPPQPKVSDSSKTDPSKTVATGSSSSSSSSSAAAAAAAPAADKSNENPEAKTSQTSSESTEKKGDKPSARQAYVPPPERGLMGGEVKVLEPMRLSKTRTAHSSRQGPTPDIQDERAFPSLG